MTAMIVLAIAIPTIFAIEMVGARRDRQRLAMGHEPLAHRQRHNRYALGYSAATHIRR